MTIRLPLVVISGTPTELPGGDTLPVSILLAPGNYGQLLQTTPSGVVAWTNNAYISGVLYVDGTSNFAGTLATTDRLSSTNVVSSPSGEFSKTLAVGVVNSGVWQASPVGTQYGGTSHTTYTSGQLLIGKGDGTLAKTTLSAGTDITITNGDGSITINNPIGSVALASGNAALVLGTTALASGNAALGLGATALASGNAALVRGTTALASGNAALVVATNALPKAGGTMTGNIVFAGTQPTATTSSTGIVQLTDSTSSTSTTTAATPNSVKSAYDLADAALPKSGGTITGTVYTRWQPLLGKTHISDYTAGVFLTGSAGDYSLADNSVNQVPYIHSQLYLGNGFILPKGYSNTISYYADVIAGAFALRLESSTDGVTWTTLVSHPGGTNAAQTYTFSSLAAATALRFYFQNSNGTNGRIRVASIVIPGLLPEQIAAAQGIRQVPYQLGVPSLGVGGTFPSSPNASITSAGAATFSSSGSFGAGLSATSLTINSAVLRSTGVVTVANGATLDISLPGAGVTGHLYVNGTSPAGAGSRTSKIYFIATRLGNASTVTQLNTANGSTAGVSYTVTDVSTGSDNVIRFTNTQGSDLSVIMSFVGMGSF